MNTLTTILEIIGALAIAAGLVLLTFVHLWLALLAWGAFMIFISWFITRGRRS